MTPLFWVVVAQAGPTEARVGQERRLADPPEGRDERTTRNRLELDHRAGGRRRFRREGRGRRSGPGRGPRGQGRSHRGGRDGEGPGPRRERPAPGARPHRDGRRHLGARDPARRTPAPLHRCRQGADRRAPRAGRGPRRRGRGDRRLGPDCGRAGRAPRRPGAAAWPQGRGRRGGHLRPAPSARLPGRRRRGRVRGRPFGPQRRPEHRARHGVVCVVHHLAPRTRSGAGTPGRDRGADRVPAPVGDPLVVGAGRADV